MYKNWNRVLSRDVILFDFRSLYFIFFSKKSFIEKKWKNTRGLTLVREKQGRGLWKKTTQNEPNKDKSSDVKRDFNPRK